jgi:WD40 repeat protein
MTLFRLIKERIGDHPNIVRLLEVYFDAPPFYVEEEYVAGQDLKGWCEGQGGVAQVRLDTRLEIVAQVADALQAAHDAGVIHRDVKPGNILVSGQWVVGSGQRSEVGGEGRGTREFGVPPLGGRAEGSAARGGEGSGGPAEAGTPHLWPLATRPSSLQVKLADFGIGQVVSAEALAGVTRAGFTQTMLGPSSSSQTGTQLYMAPELLAGKPASTRSDICSLGVVLYQLLVGDFTHPVTGDWSGDITDPLLRDDLQHCLAGKPEERFAGAAQLAESLRAYRQREARRLEQQLVERRLERRRRVAVAAGAVTAVSVLVAVALGYGLWRAQVERAAADANAYAADISLAHQALAANDLGKARTLLGLYGPGTGREYLRGFEWRYLTAQCRSDALATDTADPTAVFRLALSPDGRILAVGRGNGWVQLYDAKTLKCTATLETNGPYAGTDFSSAVVGFAPVGDLLAVGAGPRTIRLWRLGSRQVLGELVNTNANTATCLSFSPDAKRLAVFHWLGGACIWDLETRRVIWRYPNFGSEGQNSGEVAFSPNGQTLAVGDSSGRIRLIDWAADRVVGDIRAHPLPVTCLAYSPDGQVLVSGSGYSSGTIKLSKPDTGEVVGSLDGHGPWICALQFSADGRRLVSSSADQTVRIWDVAARRDVVVLRGHSQEVWGLGMSADGATLVSGDKDGTLCRWPTESDRALSPRVQPPVNLRMPVFVDEDATVAGLDDRGAVVLWDSRAARSPSVVEPLGTNNSSLAAAPARGWLAAGGGSGQVRVCLLPQGKAMTNLIGLTGGPRLLSFCNEGRGLVAVDWGAQATVWDTATWTKVRGFQTERNVTGTAENLVSGAVSPDGRWLVLGLLDGRLSWCEMTAGTMLADLPAHRQTVLAVAFSPDSTVLASAGGEGTVTLWQVKTRRKLAERRFHSLSSLALAFSAEGSRLVTGVVGGEKAVNLWDVRTRRELLNLPAEGNLFLHVAFSHDGNAVLAASSDRQCYLWRVPPFGDFVSPK